MVDQASLVSVVIPTKNSASLLEACLRSLRHQNYPRLEIILVDGQSADHTATLASEYRCRLLQFDPRVPPGAFDAPHRRNYGVTQATGDFVYYVDADMELTQGVIAEAVDHCRAGAAAVIIPEDSFGIGRWARAKNLERRCYWGDDTVEAPRFFPRSVWQELGGLDESLGGGGDDWDLYQNLRKGGYPVARTRRMVRHNEGELQLRYLMRKRFRYGLDTLRYVRKRPRAAAISYFPIRAAYLRNWRLLLSRPVDLLAFLVMRAAEYMAGFAGILYGWYRFGWRHER